MPTYVYECPECGEFEIVQPITEDALTHCGCGEPVKRIPQLPAGFQMPAETTSPRYQEWFHSESTQAKLKSGEYEIAGKDHNINHL